MRAIDADELKKKAFGRRGGLIHTADIDAMPTIEERKTGKWIRNSPVTQKCDQCGFVIPDWEWHRFKFCPNCSARMIREGEDHERA